MGRASIPTTVIALVNDEMVGSACLVESDMPSRRDLSPWVGSVYVRPEYRRHGIGTQLMQYIENIARKLGIERLYLFTPNMSPFYETIGWVVLEYAQHRGRPTTIMEKKLAD